MAAGSPARVRTSTASIVDRRIMPPARPLLLATDCGGFAAGWIAGPRPRYPAPRHEHLKGREDGGTDRGASHRAQDRAAAARDPPGELPPPPAERRPPVRRRPGLPVEPPAPPPPQ